MFTPRIVIEQSAPKLYDGKMASPFWGRKAELDTCCRLIEDHSSRCRTISVEGIPGIGKTAFLHKLVNACKALHYKTALGNLIEGRENIVLHPWVQILERLRILSIDTGDTQTSAAPDALFRALYERWETLPGLAELAEENRKYQVFSWIGSFLASALSDHPIVICIDNAHLCDASSIQLLKFLPQLLEDFPIVFLVGYRSLESDHNTELQLFREEAQYFPNYQHVRLGNLEPAEIEAREVRATDNSSIGLSAAQLYEMTQGNPLKLSVLLRLGSVRDEGSDSLSQLWLAYKSKVSSTAVEVLEYLSFFGNSFTEPEVKLLHHVYSSELLELSIRECMYHQILIQTASSFAFFHDRFREIICDSLAVTRRNSICERLAVWLQNDDIPLDLRTLKLADLYSRIPDIGDDETRLTVYRTAGSIAQERNDWASAIRHYRSAVGAAGSDLAVRRSIETDLVICCGNTGITHEIVYLLNELVPDLIEHDEIQNLYKLIDQKAEIWYAFSRWFEPIVTHLKSGHFFDGEQALHIDIVDLALKTYARNNQSIDVDLIEKLESRIEQGASDANRYLFWFLTQIGA